MVSHLVMQTLMMSVEGEKQALLDRMIGIYGRSLIVSDDLESHAMGYALDSV